MSELPRKAVARTARLAALPLGYAGRTALGLGRRMGGASAEMVLIDVQQRTAEQLFRTLGELKGGAMKFGQAMSIFEAALPDELAAPYREQLTKLQDSAPPMPTMTVREILARELGADWKDFLVELDPVPAAAASIGQVHKGRWVDGREVAVKVQYPGAAEALASDLRQIARVARGLGPLVPGIDIKPLVEELQARAVEELDYQLEAEAQRIFAEEFRDDPDIVIPDVVASAGTVLVTEWMESPNSLAHVIREGTQEERDHYGYHFLRFMFGTPARTGMLHADPHPATSGCSPARTAARAGSACSTSAPSPGCPSGTCPTRWVRSSGSRRWRTTRSWSPRCATRASSANASGSTPNSCVPIWRRSSSLPAWRSSSSRGPGCRSSSGGSTTHGVMRTPPC